MIDLPDVELSDPRFETANLRYASCQSSALMGRGELCLFAPPLTEAVDDVPIVVLLHGITGSHWAWPFQGGAHHTAMRMMRSREVKPMVIVMPSDSRFRLDATDVSTVGHEEWVGVEAVDVARKLLPQASRSSPVFVAGVSMGGFAALRLAAKHPSAYVGAAAHSPVTRLSQLGELTSYGSKPKLSPADEKGSVVQWMERRTGDLPPIAFDCGLQDPLIDGCRELHRDLDRLGVEHTYQELDGDHSWSYWAERVSHTLRFFDSLL